MAAGRGVTAGGAWTVAVEATERVATGAGRELAEAARPLRSAPAEAASERSACATPAPANAAHTPTPKALAPSQPEGVRGRRRWVTGGFFTAVVNHRYALLPHHRGRGRCVRYSSGVSAGTGVGQITGTTT